MSGCAKGIALVQVAILLMFIGVLLFAGVRMLGPFVSKEKRLDTKEIIEAAVESIVGYASIYDRLPAQAQFAGIVRDYEDVWGNDIVYRPAIELLADDSICARSTTSLSLCKEDSGCTTDTIDNVAFFILSRGENLNIQTDVQQGTDPATIQVYSTGLADVDDLSGTDIFRPEFYRDITKWMDLKELRIRAGCKGHRLNIINSSLPSGIVLQNYLANVYAEKGVPFTSGGGDYKWCVTSNLTSLNLNYYCNATELTSSPACDWDGSTETGTWGQCTSLEISGTPGLDDEGIINVPIYVRDDDDNIAQKVFGIMIEPEPGLNICSDYRVWNLLSSTNDYQLDGVCNDIDSLAEATVDGVRTLNTDETIRQYSTQNSSCSSFKGAITWKQAIIVDFSADCCVGWENHPIIGRRAVDIDCGGFCVVDADLIIKNSTGSSIWYRTTGSGGMGCTEWTSDGSSTDDIAVSSGQTLNTYGTGGTCTGGSTCSETYSDLRAIDNAHCSLELTAPESACDFQDLL